MNERRRGFFFGLAAYLVWGLFPIYFASVAAIGPIELIGHRILWSFVTLALIIPFAPSALRELLAIGRNRKGLATAAAGAALILTNWSVYVYAATTGRVLEASLGYFISPILSVVLGAVFLGEKLGLLRWLAVGLAAAAVARLALGAPESLFVACGLGFSFAFYGLARRSVPLGPASGLLLECAFGLPLALALLLVLGAGDGLAFFASDGATQMLVLLAGVVTIIPLALFTAGAKRLDYATIGMMMFIVPSMLFFQGWLLFGEPLDQARLQAFLVIWSALALYVIGANRSATTPDQRD